MGFFSRISSSIRSIGKSISSIGRSSRKGLLGATETRAITNIATKNLDSDNRGEKEPNDLDFDWNILRDYLYLFSLKHWREIEMNYKDDSLYKDSKLKKRDLQIWKPLLAIATLINHDLFSEILEFAEKISDQRRDDFISDDSWDYKILKIVRELLEGTTIIRPKDIMRIFGERSSEEEKNHGAKFFAGRLDNLGFKDLRKKRDKIGVFFEITKNDFEIIVSPLCPDLSYNYSTLSTLSTPSLINNKNKVLNVNNKMTKMSKLSKSDVESDENVENDESMRCKDNKIEVVKVPSAHDLKQKKQQNQK